ncbi:MAG: ABC transporter ATP-binding protein, partial [Acidimicrobiia bacterium]|nr:ABC transporter ATP-binding protein [Acidimicrobiia bacterium]
MPPGPPPHRLFGSDPAAIAGAQIREDLVRRVWGFARPYRRMLLIFLVVLIGEALLAITPPLLIKQVVDGALKHDDSHQLTVLVGLMVAAALGTSLLSLVDRWLSARIGEGLIYDLRSRLFDHVQRMPIAFFTRTQTGALVSRMNNDVIGAQSAVTGTLGSVVSNTIVLATTLTAMVILEWRITIVALVLLPVFIVPAKRVGRRLQALTRESFNLNASMNNTMTERFGVSGALLVKLFGRHDVETVEFSDRAGRVR